MGVEHLWAYDFDAPSGSIGFSSSAPDLRTVRGATMNNVSGDNNGCGLGFDADSIEWRFPASALDASEVRIKFDWTWDIEISGATCDLTANHTRLVFQYSVDAGTTWAGIEADHIND